MKRESKTKHMDLEDLRISILLEKPHFKDMCPMFKIIFPGLKTLTKFTLGPVFKV